MDLTDIRKKIDAIDRELSALLEQRMEIVREVAAYKIEHHIAVLDTEREKQLLEEIKGRLAHSEHARSIESIYHEILRTSRQMQRQLCDRQKNIIDAQKASDIGLPMAVAYQGAEGSFGEQAAASYFADRAERIGCYDFEDVIEAVETGKARYGILPVENSLAGTVTVTNDLVRKSSLHVVAEVIEPITHHLMARPGVTLEDITAIYSHPKALEQCSLFLKTLKKPINPYVNTAQSAKKASEEKTAIAAVASERAATLYGLHILQRNIANYAHNFTRFWIVAKQEQSLQKPNKTSIVLTVNDEPGALYHMLGVFNAHQINMHKIESRPVEEKAWEYYFYVDFEGPIEQQNVQEMLARLSGSCSYFRLLGCYRAGM